VDATLPGKSISVVFCRPLKTSKAKHLFP